jgi:hypothetical protein
VVVDKAAEQEAPAVAGNKRSKRRRVRLQPLRPKHKPLLNWVAEDLVAVGADLACRRANTT